MSQTVFVVDDDAAMRDALTQLLETAGLQVESYADGPTFLAACKDGFQGCLLLDMAMPGMTGHEVQAELNARGEIIPIIFLSGHGDIPLAVRAVQAGAVGFLEKPIQGAVLLEWVQRALVLEHEWRRTLAHSRAIQQRYASLSPRERQCMAMVVSGLPSKAVARELGISPRTVEVHRTHVMHKMGAANLADLINMAACCKT